MGSMGILLLTLAFVWGLQIHMLGKVTCENVRGSFTVCVVFIKVISTKPGFHLKVFSLGETTSSVQLCVLVSF